MNKQLLETKNAIKEAIFDCVLFLADCQPILCKGERTP